MLAKLIDELCAATKVAAFAMKCYSFVNHRKRKTPTFVGVLLQ